MLDLEHTIERKETAQKIIQKRMLYSAGLGFIPFPLFDAAAIASNQVLMIRQLSKLYGISFKEHRAKSLIGTLVGTIGTFSVIKFIPGLGSLLGGTALSVGAAAATYAVGKLFRQHFDQGGTLLDFDPVKSRKYFLELQKEGISVAQNLEAGKDITSQEDNTLVKTSHKEIVAPTIKEGKGTTDQEDNILVETPHKEIVAQTLKEDRDITSPENSTFIETSHKKIVTQDLTGDRYATSQEDNTFVETPHKEIPNDTTIAAVQTLKTADYSTKSIQSSPASGMITSPKKTSRFRYLRWLLIIPLLILIGYLIKISYTKYIAPSHAVPEDMTTTVPLLEKKNDTSVLDQQLPNKEGSMENQKDTIK